MHYAEVAINAAVNSTFHYHIPDDLTVRIGHLVRVAFGTAMQQGIVIALHDDLPPDLQNIDTKPIRDVLDRDPVMTATHIDLALWMSDQYLTPPGLCLWLMLPPGITRSSQQMVELIQEPDDLDALTPMQQAVIEALRDTGALAARQLKRTTGYKTVVKAAREMAAQGWVRVYSRLRPRQVSEKTVRTVQLAIPPDELESALDDLSNAPKQTRVFKYIARFDYPLDASDVYDAVDATSTDLNNLEARGLVQQAERVEWRDSLVDAAFVPVTAPELTPEQQTVWEHIQPFIQPDAAESASGDSDAATPPFFLLHGVTGSGKTEIYLRAIAETIAQGRQAIFLVPEIALTPQTIRRVAQRFPQRVAIVHGSLSRGERYDTWRRARAGDIDVIVGTRSALFTPLPDLGLVILDEEHDTSYKQAPTIQPPYYHARAAAEKLMQLNEGVVILGSATPDIETYYRAQHGDLRYLHLPSRIMGHRKRLEDHALRKGVDLHYAPATGDAMTIDLPPVTVVDMRDELKKGNRSMFSYDLQQALRGVLERGEQAMLLLNRRGQATYVFCRDCGYVVECDNCDSPMTYHRHGEAMRCHHCGEQKSVPETCPACQSFRIKYFGAGTQQVEAALRDLLPQAQILRWDADTVTKPDLHGEILARFISGEANILVGTQMIAKGLDLPLVTLVGVVSADPGLALPDFRANERAFQLLTQVAGRAGRGILGGQVIIQTYQPQHESIVAAANHDYETFYAQEISTRRQLGYPPFRRLARILVYHTHPIEAQRHAESIAHRLQQRIEKQHLTDTHLIGPAPCFFSRIDKHYRWQILIRSADPLAALRGTDWVSNSSKKYASEYVDIDPVDVL